MSDVFNNNPSVFVDLNTLFLTLNKKTGLDVDQWRAIVENTNYLYNHLGLADVSVGEVRTMFTAPGERFDIEVSHREETIDGKTVDYFDYMFYVPTPKIEATLISEMTSQPEEVGMTINQKEIYGEGDLSNVIIGYKFNFSAKLLQTENVVVDAEMSDTSENAVQNKVIKTYVDNTIQQAILDSWEGSY